MRITVNALIITVCLAFTPKLLANESYLSQTQKILSDLNKYITLYNRIQYTYDNRITTSILPKDYNINSPAAYSDPGSYMGMYHGLCGGLMPPILAMTRERSQSDS